MEEIALLRPVVQYLDPNHRKKNANYLKLHLGVIEAVEKAVTHTWFFGNLKTVRETSLLFNEPLELARVA